MPASSAKNRKEAGIYIKVWRLHAALFAVYYFSYIEQTAVRQMGITLTNLMTLVVQVSH
jgi:hypothetical protein